MGSVSREDGHIERDKARRRSNLYRIFPFLICSFAVFFSFIPNLFPGIPEGSDAPFHLARIWSLAGAIREGIFPVKVHPQLCWGMGYGVGFFYDDALLYFPALLICAGLSLETAYKLFILAVFILMAVSMYKACRAVGGERILSSLGAAMYLVSYRVAGQLYLDFTIGNLCGAVFMPLAIAGLDTFLSPVPELMKTGESQVERDGSKGLWMFGIGFAGLLYSHAISTLLTFTVCVLLLLIYIKPLFAKWQNFLQLILTTVTVILITAAYWLPMLQQFHVQTYKNAAPWTTEEENVLSFSGLIANTRGIGIMVLLAAALSLIFLAAGKRIQKGNDDGKNKYCDFFVHEAIRHSAVFLFLGMIFALLPCWHSFWHNLNRHLTLIQFPARLFLPATVLFLFALTSGGSFLLYQEKWRIRKNLRRARPVVLVTVLIVFAVGCLDLYFHFYPDSFANTGNQVIQQVENMSVAGAGAGQEWLPIETDLDSVHAMGQEAAADDGSVAAGERYKHDSVYTFTPEQGRKYYDVPVIYYRGYSAVTAKGTALEISKSDSNGLVRVYLPDEYEDKLTVNVFYSGTGYQKLAYAFSLVGLLAAAILGLRGFTPRFLHSARGKEPGKGTGV